MSVKLKYASARHIVAVWNFPTPLKYDGQDFCDDQDHGVGRHILQMMRQNDISHRVIFAIRHCKQKLYDERLPLYTESVKQLLLSFPGNSILQTDQRILIEQDVTKR